MRLPVLGWGGMNKDCEVSLVFRLLQPPLSKTFFFSSLFSMSWAPVLFPVFLFIAWTILSVHRRTGAWVGGYVGPSGTRDTWYLSPFPSLQDGARVAAMVKRCRGVWRLTWQKLTSLAAIKNGPCETCSKDSNGLYPTALRQRSVTPMVSCKDTHRHIAKQSHWLSSWFWDRQKFGNKSSHAVSHLLLVPAPVGYGTPVSKFHHLVQHSLKREGRHVEAAFSSCSVTYSTPTSYHNSKAGESSVEGLGGSRIGFGKQPVLCCLRSLGSLTILVIRLYLLWARWVEVAGFLEQRHRRAPVSTKHIAAQMLWVLQSKLVNCEGKGSVQDTNSRKN